MRRTLLLLASVAGLRAHAQTGTVTEQHVASKTYARERRVWVYTPPGYRATGGTAYDVVVAFDGNDYQHDIPLPHILDSLLAAHASPPFVALLVDDSSGAARTNELGNSDAFAAFLGDELMPWLRAHYAVTTDPHRTIVTGSSAGGLGAAFVALRRPDLFGKVLSQSGAFWRGPAGGNGGPYQWLTEQYRTSPKRDLVFLLDVGDRETVGALGGAAPSLRDANRKLRDVLTAKGYKVTYTEVPGGQHRPEDWKVRLPGDLVAIARASATP